MTDRQKIFIAALGIFVLSMFLNAAASQPVKWGIADEGAYAQLAEEIANQGTFWEFPGYYLSGRFKATIRGPVYVWFLSLLQDGEGLNRGVARAINAVVGAIAAVMIFLLVSRLWDRRIGIGAATIAAVSKTTTLYGGIVAVESLLMVGSLGAWYYCLRALEPCSIEDASLIAALGLSAAGYYLKAQVVLFIPVTLVTALVAQKSDFLRRRCLWLGVLIIALILSLNVARNINAFGEPFRNRASAEQWIDDPQQKQEPGWREKYGGPVQYFRRHTLGQFAQRMINGMILQVTTVAHDLLGPTRISRALSGVSRVVGSVLFAAFLIGLVRESNPRWLIFHLIVVGMYALMFALRSGAMNAMYARWYLPLLGMFGAYSAAGLRQVWRGLCERLPEPRLRVLQYVLWVGAAGYALITVRKILVESGIAVWIVQD